MKMPKTFNQLNNRSVEETKNSDSNGWDAIKDVPYADVYRENHPDVVEDVEKAHVMALAGDANEVYANKVFKKAIKGMVEHGPLSNESLDALEEYGYAARDADKIEEEAGKRYDRQK